MNHSEINLCVPPQLFPASKLTNEQKLSVLVPKNTCIWHELILSLVFGSSSYSHTYRSSWALQLPSVLVRDTFCSQQTPLSHSCISQLNCLMKWQSKCCLKTDPLRAPAITPCSSTFPFNATFPPNIGLSMISEHWLSCALKVHQAGVLQKKYVLIQVHTVYWCMFT